MSGRHDSVTASSNRAKSSRLRHTMSARSVVGNRCPTAGFDRMSPALTAAFSALLKMPCLLAMVLPEAPLTAVACIQSAMSSLENAASGIGPRTGLMSFFAYDR